MKKIYVLLVAVVLNTTLFLSNIFAQDYTKWHLPPGAKARLGKGWINDIKFSPYGDRLAVATTIGVWIYDVRTGKEVDLITDVYTDDTKLFPESMGGTNAISYSPGGVILAAAHWDRKIRLWDVSSDHLYSTTGREPLFTFEGHTGAVYDVAFSSDGSLLASGSADNTIRVWDVHAEKLISILPYKDSVYTVAFSPDNRLLAGGSGDGTIQVWDAGTGDQIYEFKEHTDSVWAVDFSPDRTNLASASLDGSVRLWSLVAAGGKLHAPTQHNTPVYAVKFSPDGSSFATGSADKLIQLWDTSTAERNLTLTGHKDLVSDVDFSPDGNTLASGSPDGTILLWDKIGDRARIKIPGHTGGVKALVYTEDNRIRACGTGLDGKLRLWDAGTSSELSIFREHTGLTQAVTFSKNGKMLASGGNEEDTIFLSDVTKVLMNSNSLDAESLISVLSGNTHGITALALSPADTTLASGGKDGRIHLLNIKVQRELKILRGSQSTITALTFVHDGTILFSGEKNGSVRQWNALSGEEDSVAEPDSNPITALAFSPDAHFLAIGNEIGTIWLYDVIEKRKRIITTRHTRKITALVFSNDDTTLVSGSEDGTILLWDMNEVLLNTGVQDNTSGEDSVVERTIPQQEHNTTEQTVQQIAQKALASTVYLRGYDVDGKELGAGSGFFVGTDKVATNHHVIKGTVSIYAKIVGEEEWYVVESITATDETHDLAVLKLSGITAPALPLTDSDAVQVGDSVYAVGNPERLEGTFSEGIISSIRGEGNNKWIQMTASISPGSSGGAVLNNKGKVIGVATASHPGAEAENLNFAVPSNYLKALLRRAR